MNIFTKTLALAALSLSISANAQDFIPASIAPESGALENGQTVVLTYNTYIDWFMRVNEYNNTIAFEPLNGKATDPISVSSYQGAVINMKTCKITLHIPQTGYEDVTDWALVIPANQIVNPITNAGNEAMRIEYRTSGTGTNPGENPGQDPETPKNMVPVSVTPASGSELTTPFTQIVIAFPEAADDMDVNPFNFDDPEDFMNYSFTGPNGKSVSDVQFFTLGNELVFDSFNITEPGEYTLILKKGFVTSVLGENELITLSWTVIEDSGNEAETPKMMPVSVTPEAGSDVVAPFTQIVIEFPETANDIEANPFNFDDFFDFMNYSFTGPTGKEVSDVQFFTLGNELIFDSFKITEPGEYTLLLKKGFVTGALGENETITLTWNVVTEEAGIDNIGVDNVQSIYFDLSGRRLSNPNPGQIVIKITGSKAVKMIL